MTVWWALTGLATGNHGWKSKDKKDVDRTQQESKGHPPRGPHFLPVLFFSWSCISPLPGGLSHIFIHEDLTPCLIYFSSITSAQWLEASGQKLLRGTLINLRGGQLLLIHALPASGCPPTPCHQYKDLCLLGQVCDEPSMPTQGLSF